MERTRLGGRKLQSFRLECFKGEMGKEHDDDDDDDDDDDSVSGDRKMRNENMVTNTCF